jgi:hypothetical protein
MEVIEIYKIYPNIPSRKIRVARMPASVRLLVAILMTPRAAGSKTRIPHIVAVRHTEQAKA